MRDSDWVILSELYQHRNITKTAASLFLSQPTLTKRIQNMEEELGTELILRTPKGIRFTADGEQVARKAREIVASIRELELELSNGAGELSGTLKIGAPNSYVRLVLPSLLEQFSQRYPKVRVEITTALSNEVGKLVESQLVDVGFVRGAAPAYLQKRLLSRDQIYLVSRQPLDLAILPELPQIEYTKEPTLTQATQKWWQQYYTQMPNVRIRVQHADACLAMIRHNLGYGIISDSNFFRGDDNLLSIPMVNLDGSTFTRNTYVVYRSEYTRFRLVRSFLAFLEEMEFSSL